MLRLIAVISMIMDHAALLLIGYGIMSGLPVGSDAYERWNAIVTGLRVLGRMAFPIFAWLIAEGYARTRDWRKYAVRLFLLALISELPFDWVAFGRWGVQWGYQNTVFTLLLGLLALRGGDFLQGRMRRIGYGTGSWYTAIMAATAAACVAALVIRSDYSWEGVILIVLLYHTRADRKRQCIMGFLWSAVVWGILLPPVFMTGYAAAFLLLYYLRECGVEHAVCAREPVRRDRMLRWAVYLVYPVHLLILWGIYCRILIA